MKAEESLPMLDAIDSGQPLLIEHDNVVHLNSLQVAHANRFVFASNDDFSLVDEMLNANPELSGPPQLVVQ